MGKKSLLIALAKIYSSIYRATTIPLLYTSMFWGNALFVSPCFAEESVRSSTPMSYSILKNLPLFAREYQISPLYSNSNNQVYHGPFYMRAFALHTKEVQKKLSNTVLNDNKYSFPRLETLHKSSISPTTDTRIMFDLEDNENGLRIALQEKNTVLNRNNQIANFEKKIRKEHYLPTKKYMNDKRTVEEREKREITSNILYSNEKKGSNFRMNEGSSVGFFNSPEIEKRNAPQLRYDIHTYLSFDRDASLDMVTYETILAGRYDILNVVMINGGHLSITRGWNRLGGHVEMGNIVFNNSARFRDNSLLITPQNVSLEMTQPISMVQGDITFDASRGSGYVLIGRGQKRIIDARNLEYSPRRLTVSFVPGSYVTGFGNWYSIYLRERGNDTVHIYGGARLEDLEQINFYGGNNYLSVESSGTVSTQEIHGNVEFESGNDGINIKDMIFKAKKINMGSGNNSVRIVRGELHSEFSTGNGNDHMYIDAGIWKVVSDLSFADGDDTLHVTARGSISASNIYMGNGNDSVILSRAGNIPLLYMGSGNDTVHFLEAQNGIVSNLIRFESGDNVLRLDRNVHYAGRELSVLANSTLTIDVAENATITTPDSLSNLGLLNINLNNKSNYRGKGTITTGRVHARILNGSWMHTNLTTGNGNDTLFMSQGTIDGSVNLGSGNNSIVLDRSTMTGAGNRIYVGTGTSAMELRNNLSFLGANSSILMEGGVYSLLVKDLNMDRNIADITMTGTGRNSVMLQGNIVRMGRISTGNGNSSVEFDGAKTIASNIGTISMGIGQDIVKIYNGSVVESILNLGSSGNGADSIIVEDTSRIGLGANLIFTGNLHFMAKDSSIVDATLNLPGKATVVLQDKARFNNGFVIDTEEKVILNMFGESIFDGNIDVNTNKSITFEVSGQDKAIINDDIVTGKMNDFISVALSNDALIAGSIMTGSGNDTLRLRLESALGIQGLDMGEGNDSVEILGGVISGTTRSFVLGTGNNTVSILGNTTIYGGIMIDIPAINTFLIDNGNRLLSDIFTGVSEGILTMNRGGVLDGTINGATRLSVDMKGNSTITGNIAAGTEDATVLLEQSFVGGSVESNQGGDLSFIARNSTVEGGITSTAPGVAVNTHIELRDSLIRGNVTSEDIVVSSSRSILEGTLRVQGASVINLANSTINGGISTSVGNANILSINSVISGGVSVSRGEHTISLTGGSVEGGIVLSNSMATITGNNVAIVGNITLMPSGGLPFTTKNFGNSIAISGGSIHGSILGERNLDSNIITLTSTKMTGGIYLGLGDNTLRVNNSQIDRILEIRNADMIINNGSFLGEGIRFEGMSKTLIQDSIINGTLDFSSKTLGTQIVTLINSSYKGDLHLGNVLNTFTLQNVTTTGNIYGGRFSDSLSLIGSTIYGDIQLGSEQDTLSMSDGTQIFGKEVRSNIISIRGDIVLKSVDASNFVLSSNVGIDGKILFHQGANIVLNPGIVGDTLLVEGLVENNTFGSNFTLDTDFYTAQTDSIRIGDGTEVKGNRITLRFTPSHIIDGSKKLIPLIENVIMTDKAIMASPGVLGGAVAVGGYLYNLIPNEYATGWNLQIGGKNPTNGGYAATVVSNKNYSRVMWENIGERITNGLLGRGTLDEKKTKNWNDMPLGDHFSVWSNVQVSINTINGPALPNMSEKLLLSSAGVDIKNIDSNSTDRFSISAFGAYGASTSDLQHKKSIKFSSDLEAFSIGTNMLWENLRGKKEHRIFMTAAFWGDIYKNTLFSPYSSVAQSWNTYALNASVGVGYRMVLGQFSFIPQAELLYTYAVGHELIAEDKSLILFQDEHRIVLKTGALFAYNFRFGLKPYVRVGLEIPIASVGSASGTSVAGEEYKYNTDAVLTRLGVGLNYTVQVSGLEINTFVDTFMHMGREQGVNANVGVSIGF
ncbi:MAG: hypothetical protein ACRCV3_00385 [Desulfovibrionaceae bacterium]